MCGRFGGAVRIWMSRGSGRAEDRVEEARDG